MIISDCDFNFAMSIDQLRYGKREGDSDVYYTLELTEYSFLNVPAVKAAVQPTTPANGLSGRPNAQPVPKTHTVVAGNTLWGIAAKYYGSGAQYAKIYSANKALIGCNPNVIKVGQKLVIP